MNTDDTDLQSQNGSIELFDPCKSVLSVLSVVRFGFLPKASRRTQKPGVAARPSPTKGGEKRLLLGRSHFFVQFQQRLNGHLCPRRRLKERGIRLIALD